MSFWLGFLGRIENSLLGLELVVRGDCVGRQVDWLGLVVRILPLVDMDRVPLVAIMQALVQESCRTVSRYSWTFSWQIQVSNCIGISNFC